MTDLTPAAVRLDDPPRWKLRCLWLAECVDAWRILPRCLLVAYCFFVYNITDRLLSWYMTLPINERTLEAGGFAAAIFTVITGLGTMFVNTYLKSGRRWNGSKSTE